METKPQPAEPRSYFRGAAGLLVAIAVVLISDLAAGLSLVLSDQRGHWPGSRRDPLFLAQVQAG